VTPRQLKKAMEKQWEKPGCSDPLKPARWATTYNGKLAPNYDLDVPDPDDGDPLDA